MKKYKYLILVLAILANVFYMGCDDSGIVKPNNVRGTISFTQTNLKPLTTGMYELWLSLMDSTTGRQWYTLGQFNVNSSGFMVNANGEAVEFKYQGDTNMLNNSQDILVTYEIDNDFVPSNYRIMSGLLNVTADTITANLNIGGGEAFGNVGNILAGISVSPATGGYTLCSPTTGNAECTKGLWLSDSSGNSVFTSGLDMPGHLGWKYQAWAVRLSTGDNFKIGYFTSFDNADEDGPGPCPGPNPAFNKPGQEFLTGCPSGDILNSGDFGFFITIEPDGVSLSQPFPFRIFYRPGGIVPSLACRVRDPFLKNVALDDAYPRGKVKIYN